MNTSVLSSSVTLVNMQRLWSFGWVHAMAQALRDVFGILKDMVVPASGVPARPYVRVPSVEDNGRDSVLVLDASGSMMTQDWKPSRLEGAKAAAKAYVKRLSEEEPDARVAVVGYGDGAKTLCRLTPARDLDGISRSIDRLDCMGSTNMKAGLQEALRLLKGQRQTRQVVLMSDGHSTEQCPLRTAEELKEFAVVECVGIASKKDVDAETLKEIASAYPDGTRRYRWIGDKEQLVQHFRKLAGRITRS